MTHSVWQIPRPDLDFHVDHSVLPGALASGRQCEVVVMDQKTETSALDFPELLERCLGNLEFAERVLAKFQSRFDDDLTELEKALDVQDTEAVARVAHRLKGASATAAANGICHQAAEIETLARNKSVEEIPNHLHMLRKECSRFSDSVSSLALASSAG
jgi:HPt (histidine-containing phosphotransfer) domain-containing protein